MKYIAATAKKQIIVIFTMRFNNIFTLYFINWGSIGLCEVASIYCCVSMMYM